MCIRTVSVRLPYNVQKNVGFQSASHTATAAGKHATGNIRSDVIIAGRSQNMRRICLHAARWRETGCLESGRIRL